MLNLTHILREPWPGEHHGRHGKSMKRMSLQTSRPVLPHTACLKVAEGSTKCTEGTLHIEIWIQSQKSFWRRGGGQNFVFHKSSNPGRGDERGDVDILWAKKRRNPIHFANTTSAAKNFLGACPGLPMKRNPTEELPGKPMSLTWI